MIIIEKRVVLSTVVYVNYFNIEDVEVGGLEVLGRDVGGEERREGKRGREGRYVNF